MLNKAFNKNKELALVKRFILGVIRQINYFPDLLLKMLPVRVRPGAVVDLALARRCPYVDSMPMVIVEITLLAGNFVICTQREI